MTSKYVLFFNEISKRDLALVGGKGANLGEMTGAGFPVPYGFCVTTEAYKVFIEHNDLSGFIAETLIGARLETITQIGTTLREKLQSSVVPEVLEQELRHAVKRAGREHSYAVRSSATAEDLAFASFAGQQDTYLNVKGEDPLLHAVRNCWASLFTDRAILYRAQNQIAHEKVYMSVVVQKMILPEVSGIMFTSDPVSGHRGIISIDASYGLGEALVSGLVSPDLYKVRKNDLQLEQKTVAEKKLAIVPLEQGGTQKIELTGEQSTRQVLEEARVKALAQLGMAIEKHYGHPQDIEWCLEKDAFYIVQSRPITSLFPLPTPQPRDNALHVYTSINYIQMTTEPISPMGIDALRMILSVDKNVKDETGYKTLTSAAGRIYADLSGLLQFKRVRRGIAMALSNMDPLSGVALAELVQRPEFDARIKKNPTVFWGLLKLISPALFKAAVNLVFKNPDGTVGRMNRFTQQNEQEMSATLKNAKPGLERLEVIYKNANLLDDFIQTILPVLAPGIISFSLLGRLEQKFLKSNHYINTLAKGLEGNITTEVGLLVGDLADMIRKSPALLEQFENPNYNTLMSRVNALQGHEDFKQTFNAFMRKHGSRAAGEIDIAKERWVENPEPLVKSLLSVVNTSKEGTHRKEYQETIEKAKAAAKEFVKEVEAKHGKLRAMVVARLVKVLRNHLPLREHHKYLAMRKLLAIKTALLEEAQMLVEKGQLAEAKDVFYVGYWELYRAIQNNESLLEVVESRKADYRHFAKLSAPHVLTSDGEEIQATYQHTDLPEGALAGIAVSSGVIEGIAKVITDPAKESLSKGEILVAPFTDPGWTPLFINAAGLVMEIGGLLTHGTVVAREYGIPAVVGVSNATTRIRTGQRIRVDGNTGFVMVVEK